MLRSPPCTKTDFLKPRKSKVSCEKHTDVDSIFTVAQVDETPELQKRGSKKRQLYKDKISAPFDCAPFMVSSNNSLIDLVQCFLRLRIKDVQT